MTTKAAAKGDSISIAIGAVLVALFVAAVVYLTVLPHRDASANDPDENFLIEINKSNFPDTVWRNYVKDNFDTNDDGYLSVVETKMVTHVGSYDSETYEVTNAGLSAMKITSLQGIEYFTNLEELVAKDNLITYLDISHNAQLKKIDMRGNPRFDVTYAQQNSDCEILVDDGAEVLPD